MCSDCCKSPGVSTKKKKCLVPQLKIKNKLLERGKKPVLLLT